MHRRSRSNVAVFIFLGLALLCGFGGGNFASSMANINAFYPQRLKGWALGINAAFIKDELKIVKSFIR